MDGGGHLEGVLEFLQHIGLSTTVRAGTAGFLPGVFIVSGGLWIDSGAAVSDVLHEAGHLATLPAAFRPLARGDLRDVMARLMASLETVESDSMPMRAAMSCGDPEATAWAWAAGCHLRLPARQVISDSDFGGDGAEIRVMLSLGAYAGIHGLAHGGFCVTRPGPLEAMAGLPAYPKLQRWLQT